MSSYNRAVIIGNLGAEPEMRATAKGVAVCNLRIATSETFKGGDGSKKERTEWHSVSVFGTQAELCAKYLAKGRAVCVEGRIQTRSWEKDGQKHYKTEIVADRVVFLGGGKEGRAGSGHGAAFAGDQAPPPASGGFGEDDGLPF